MKENYSFYTTSAKMFCYLFYFDVSIVLKISNAGVTLSRSCHKMVIRMWNFEFRAKFVPNFDISQSTAEVITMPTEDHTIALEHNTRVPRSYFEGNTEMSFYVRYLYEGNTTVGNQNGSFRRKYAFPVPFGGRNGSSRRKVYFG